MSYRCPARPSKYRRQAFTDTDRHQTQSGSIWSRESEACSASSHSSFSSTSRKYHRLLVSRTSTRPSLVRCHQFLPSLYADKWLSAIPLAHCLRELTGEIRCLGGAFPVSAPPVAYLGLLGSVSLPSQLYSRARRFMPDASVVQPLAADRT